MTTRPLSVPYILKSALVIVMLFMIATALILHYRMQFSWIEAIADSIISLSALAGGCYVISNLLGYYQPKNEKNLFLLILIVFLTLVIVYFGIYSLKFIFSGDRLYLTYLYDSILIRIGGTFFTLFWCTLTCILWYRQEEQAASQERLLNAQNLAKEAELNKLRHQLQPHFLFNSLNSVYALTIVNPTEAGTMITKLAAFLRGTLKRDDEVWVSVAEEMEYIQLYLDIEKVRFSHRLNVSISISEDALDQTLPGTLLQPIVENAIKFGLYNTSSKITISISVTVENNVLLVQVENPYDPNSPAEKGTGFGLSAIRRRLYLLFAENTLLQTETIDNELYITKLRIPQTHDQNRTH